MTDQERYLSAALLELVARERATGTRLVLWLSDGSDLARRWCARLKLEWSEELPRDEWRVHFVRQATDPGAVKHPQRGDALRPTERLVVCVLGNTSHVEVFDLEPVQAVAAKVEEN